MAAHYRDSLESRNEIAFFVSMYQTADKVREVLRKCGLNVAGFENDGALLIYDSVKGYQTSEGVYAVLALINMLIERAKKMDKSGVFGMADMGSFFMHETLEKLMSYELSLPSIWKDMKLRSFCLYHQGDFDRLSGQEQEALSDHHYRYIKPY